MSWWVAQYLLSVTDQLWSPTWLFEQHKEAVHRNLLESPCKRFASNTQAWTGLFYMGSDQEDLGNKKKFPTSHGLPAETFFSADKTTQDTSDDIKKMILI